MIPPSPTPGIDDKRGGKKCQGILETEPLQGPRLTATLDNRDIVAFKTLAGEGIHPDFDEHK